MSSTFAEFIFKITRMLTHAVAREEVFNTISYALSQVSVHLLHLCICHVSTDLYLELITIMILRLT